MPRPRVLLDFSLIDYRTRITGIPRVSYAYLEEGVRLADELGFEVIPVHIRDGELVDARPLLIQSNWRQFRAAPSASTLVPLFASGLYFTLHVLRLLAVTCVVPFFAIARFLLSYEFFDLPRNLLLALFRRSYEGSKRLVNAAVLRRIHPRSGDILFMPAWWHDTPPGHYARLRRNGVRICPLVHDVLPITHPEFYESPWREQFARWVLELLAHADHVFYVSDATRRAVQILMTNDGRRLPPGSVVHHGFDFTRARRLSPIRDEVRALLEDPGPLFLMVGSIEPKKNHLRVLSEFERLWARGAEARLVIVGQAGWKDAEIQKALLSSPHLHASLAWLEHVPDDDLQLLYRRADAVIQASEAEGFGLPVIEALALGTPVLAQDLAVFREIAGGDAVFFDIHLEGDLESKVRACIEAPLPRPDAFSWPTWRERAAALYGQLLRELTPAGAATNDRSVGDLIGPRRQHG